MQTNLVVGLGFGDEGKGRVVSALASSYTNPIVFRYNGGHQAGHTVVTDTQRHVFSSFGSGTLHGCPTYWSEFCTFYPWAVRNELEILKKLGVSPRLFVDALCPVTTNFDSAHNKVVEEKHRHGSCGVGFGSTIARHEAHYKLYFQDLFNETVLMAKLNNIMHSYYQSQFALQWEELRDRFLQSVEFVRDCSNIRMVHAHEQKTFLKWYDSVIFEGAQGILLDQDFGFFPNVTRSNTTSLNAMYLIAKWGMPAPKIYYVTRSYQTRHGNGFMSDETPPTLVNNENETNVQGPWQGVFRTGTLDLDLLRYAAQCDRNFIGDLKPNLVVTCLDQTGDVFPVISQQRKRDLHIKHPYDWKEKEFWWEPFRSVLCTTSPKADSFTPIL
jgi:adenylosuccinate synthase